MKYKSTDDNLIIADHDDFYIHMDRIFSEVEEKCPNYDKNNIFNNKKL